jgi:hypothetical protein
MTSSGLIRNRSPWYVPQKVHWLREHPTVIWSRMLDLAGRSDDVALHVIVAMAF